MEKVLGSSLPSPVYYTLLASRGCKMQISPRFRRGGFSVHRGIFACDGMQSGQTRADSGHANWTFYSRVPLI